MVRDCSWHHRSLGTGDAARRCLQVSLYVIEKSNPQHRDGCSKRALHLALRMWSPYHSFLPAFAFVEHKAEALLSCLARAVAQDTRIAHVADYHNTAIPARYSEATDKPPHYPQVSTSCEHAPYRLASMHSYGYCALCLKDVYSGTAGCAGCQYTASYYGVAGGPWFSILSQHPSFGCNLPLWCIPVAGCVAFY